MFKGVVLRRSVRVKYRQKNMKPGCITVVYRRCPVVRPMAAPLYLSSVPRSLVTPAKLRPYVSLHLQCPPTFGRYSENLTCRHGAIWSVNCPDRAMVR